MSDAKDARIRTLKAVIRRLRAELFMWEHSNCYCCRNNAERCEPGCRCNPTPRPTPCASSEIADGAA